MRYVPKVQKEGINVSNTHPLIEAGTLLVGLTAIFLIAVLTLIFLIELALFFVTEEAEARLFTDWFPEGFEQISSDDERIHETRLLMNRLVKHLPATPYTFRIEVDDSELSNAMALPGGLILVTSGLLNEVESENELAAVLGHELGHFNNRDHLRSLGRGIILSVFFAALFNNDAAGIGIKAADLTLLGFSRQQETNADEFALTLVNTEYGHVGEAWRLFERWEARDVTYSSIDKYLSTHPELDDRIVQMHQFSAMKGWQQNGKIQSLPWLNGH